MALVLLALLATLSQAAEPPAVSLSTPTFQDFLTDSGLKYAAGDFKEAADSAGRAILLAPSNARAYVQRASCELKLGDYPATEADATKAIALKYEKAAPFNLRSAARSYQGHYADALADADLALKYSAGSAFGHMNRAAAEIGLKASSADVLADYRRASELDPRYKFNYDDYARRHPAQAEPAPKPLVAAVAPQKTAPAPAAAPAPSRASSKRRPLKDWPWRAVAGMLGGLGLLALLLTRRQEHRLRQVRYGGLPSAPANSEQLASGSVVGGRYIVGAFVGRAGEVEYYEARDLSDSARLLKRVAARSGPRPAGEALSRAQRAASFKNPHAEIVEAFIQEGGHLCLVCPPLPGETLDRLCRRLPGRKLSSEAALRLLQGACEALEAAHKENLVHGRLKPSSLWVERGVGRLADFGLPPSGAGPYQPPEETPSVEGDVYALGACLYEGLTGAPPFEGEGAVLLKREGLPASPSSRGAAAGFDAILARALAPDPRNRFHSAAELLAAVRDAVSPPVQ